MRLFNKKIGLPTSTSKGFEQMPCKSKTFRNYLRSNEIQKYPSAKDCASIFAAVFYSANFCRTFQ